MDNNSGNVENLLGGDPSNSGSSDPANNPNGKGANPADSTPTKLKTSDGRMVSPEEFQKEYDSLYSGFHQKSQELAKLKEQPVNPNGNPSGEATLSKDDQALVTELERLGFTREQSVRKIVEGEAPKIIDQAAKRSVSTTELNDALVDLEIDFDGSEGKPKVEKEAILKWIISNPTTNLSPLDIARQVYYKDFVTYEAKQLAAGGTPSNLPQTENQGANVTTPPNKPVYSFKDGSALRAAQELLKKA